MTTVAFKSPPTTHEENLAPYRALCRSAVISVVLAVISLPLVTMAVISALFAYGDAVQVGMLGGAIALPAVLLGWTGWLTVRRYPDEYTGDGLAQFGLAAGLGLAICGFAASTFTYVTEVPDGYKRIGFWELQPDPEHPELPVSPKAFELTGKPVFIKGYMHPGVAGTGKVDHFILVPDMGTCCFGGQPKATDMIAVYVPNGKDRPSYSTRSIKLAGTFMLANEQTDGLGLRGVWYHLKVDQVR
jgi:hypothetical protein